MILLDDITENILFASKMKKIDEYKVNFFYIVSQFIDLT